MAVEFFIPQLGQTVEEVTIIEWLAQDGVRVDAGQTVLEVETDKATFPVEANASGVLHIGPYKPGDVVPVLGVVAVIGGPDDRFPTGVTPAAGLEPAAGGSPVEAVPEKERLTAHDLVSAPEPGGRTFASPRARRLADQKNVDLGLVVPTGDGGRRIVERDVAAYMSYRPRPTPLAQRMAAEAGIEIDGLTGTGKHGRITRVDVSHSMETASRQADVAEISSAPARPAPTSDPEVIERIPLAGVRGIVAERMAASVHATARVTLVIEVDATELAAMREWLKARVSAEWGYTPGYNDLLAKIVATALRKYPYMNARLSVDAIELLGPINLGMAVDTERGLLVPVVRNADRKSLREIGQEYRTLIERARSRKSLPEDLSGGTFTITSLGAFGVDAFTPVINLPEAAILGVGRVAPKVVPVDGLPVIRTMCTLSLVFDHRLVDGAPAARFLQFMKSLIEEPYLWLSEL